MTNQERAAELIKRADLEPADQYPLLQDIAAALAQRERETWEQAANQLDYYNDDPAHFSASLQTIVDRWRAKAQEVQP